MNKLHYKIFSTSWLNASAAGVNFISNFLIVHALSLEIFGKFAVFNSYLAFGGLIYIIIPPNYSVFKLQDNSSFRLHLIRFFILSSFAFSLYSLFIYLFFFRDINYFTIFFFGVSTFYINYFDIKFQAGGELIKYFKMLLLVAIGKVILIVFSYYNNMLHSLSDLLWTMSFVQVIIIFYYSLNDKKILKDIFLSPESFLKTIQFIRENFKDFMPYYLNTILKRIRENSIVLVFNNIVSAETLGVFSLFMKIDAFVLGLSRNVEAFFMNRENIKNHKSDFYNKIILFAFILQALYFIIGLVYMKIITNTLYWIEIFVLSLLTYPHVYFLLARAELLSNFNNKESNISEIIFVLVVLFGYIISKILTLNSVYLLLITFIVAKFGLQLYMIIKNRRYALSYSV
jgi:hypothetical protein